ncbi:MAG TPA: pyridoxal-dependent decarboxylase, partial [Candidatus Hydrogenedentes bacterium]|nr:pyridoxal-dependent decarboxylase [Candidatus Hydrogenedentota bacterium]
LVGSAPCYPYGVLDPISELGELAARRGLPLHVDACLGGFFLPWLQDLGKEVPPFDFRVPGVTSLSADIHKYGYAAKGASLLLYRSPAVFADQVFADVDWCGGAYGGATLAGTRPGGPIAAAWAALHALGREGYVENARTILEAAGRLIEGVRAVPGLCVLGNPVIGVVAVGATDPAVRMYAVADLLEARGWHINRLQKPESLQVILNAGHAAVIDPLLADLREAVGHVRAHPDAAFEGSAPMYGLIANMPLRRVVRKNLVAIFTKMHTVGEPGPEEAGEEEQDPVAVPPAVLWLMRTRARIARLFAARRGD